METEVTESRPGVFVLALTLLLGLSGCVTVQNTAGLQDSDGRRDFLRYAGAEGPVYLTVIGAPEPFAGVAGRLARAATGAVIAMPTVFTANPDLAPQSHFYIAVAFDPQVTLSPAQLCRAQTENAPLVTSFSEAETRLLLAFCRPTPWPERGCAYQS